MFSARGSYYPVNVRACVERTSDPYARPDQRAERRRCVPDFTPAAGSLKNEEAAFSQQRAVRNRGAIYASNGEIHNPEQIALSSTAYNNLCRRDA
jgi:hypothetical protein